MKIKVLSIMIMTLIFSQCTEDIKRKINNNNNKETEKIVEETDEIVEDISRKDNKIEEVVANDKEAESGANFICECSKNALENNGIDTKKMKEIYESYQSEGSLLAIYKNDVKKINTQLNLNYSKIETDIYKCRSQFKQKYRSNLKNKEFLSKLQILLNKNAFIQGPKLIKSLAN